MDTDSISEPELEFGPEPDPAPQPPSGRSHRAWAWAATLAVAAAFFGLCLAQSLDQQWNADTASMSLQGWAIVHGHLMMHGWWSSDVNFYTLDSPLYGLCLVVFGFGSFALHAAGALLYTFVFLAAAWLAKDREHGARAWLRVALTALLLTAPLFHGALDIRLILVPDHCATAIFALVSFTLVSRFAERRWAPWALLAVLAVGQFGDATVRYVAVPALLIVWFLDALVERRLRTPRLRLALAALASVPLSLGVRAVMRHYGAFYLNKPITKIAPVSDWGWHFKDTALSLLALFGAYSPSGGWSAWTIVLIFIGAIALLCGVASVLYTLMRWTKVDVADRMMVVAMAINLAAYAFTTMAQRGANGGYEFVGVVVFCATLSARTIPRLRLPGLRPSHDRIPRAVIAGIAAATAATTGILLSGTALFLAPQATGYQPLAHWLADHHLTYGLASYWNAEPITIFSGDEVQVRQIYLESGGFLPQAWNAQRQWYSPALHDADFVIAQDLPSSPLTSAEAEASFGTPSAVYRVNGLVVLVYPYNLLTRGQTVKLDPGA